MASAWSRELISSPRDRRSACPLHRQRVSPVVAGPIGGRATQPSWRPVWAFGPALVNFSFMASSYARHALVEKTFARSPEREQHTPATLPVCSLLNGCFEHLELLFNTARSLRGCRSRADNLARHIGEKSSANSTPQKSVFAAWNAGIHCQKCICAGSPQKTAW
jgi:hypothetical protein